MARGPGIVLVPSARILAFTASPKANTGKVQPVIVHASINDQGKVVEAEALQSSDPGLSNAALTLVRSLTYPADAGNRAGADRGFHQRGICRRLTLGLNHGGQILLSEPDLRVLCAVLRDLNDLRFCPCRVSLNLKAETAENSRRELGETQHRVTRACYYSLFILPTLQHCYNALSYRIEELLGP